ncbi:hypothetical protein SAMN04490243_0278 [Robiginitalea myxolifaciens]|uniref:Uncharacterized protein n=1 Tax=Robiginitalea myxolifaciens TaxID=400055 RepID=A0A1I6FNP4_9FLAO|nr:hypothetical protein [Robiginitalea myxolifaciens]SFR31570.1 hypothetical protein SAMN04490243_0278 [Robiginitalea myxolifaciens]
MEADQNNWDWKSLMADATEKAPEGFSKGVMDKIQALPEASSPITEEISVAPLLSKRTLYWVAGWFGLLLFGGIYYSQGDSLLSAVSNPLEDQFSRVLAYTESFQIPSWDLPGLPSSYGWAGLAFMFFAMISIYRIQKMAQQHLSFYK